LDQDPICEIITVPDPNSEVFLIQIEVVRSFRIRILMVKSFGSGQIRIRNTADLSLKLINSDLDP